MNKFSEFFKNTTGDIKKMTARFPAVLVSLLFISAVISVMIENNDPEIEPMLTRLIMAGVFGAFLGMSLGFLRERFIRSFRIHIAQQTVVPLLSILWFFIFTTGEGTNAEFIRLSVICFALFATALYLPSVKQKANFGDTALLHFKSAFTALLYSVVLYIGLAAVFFAIDLLLIELDDDILAHISNIVFVFFAPVYYLSLLPNFNADTNEQDVKTTPGHPRFLRILISYILVPLIAVFTAVLILYLVKIVITGIWPVGQIGPMVLGYSATGYFLYILCLGLENRFASSFRKLFPIAILPLTGLQLVSCTIRINAYGVTESRYYVVLFGVFSIACALYLLFFKSKNPNMIVLLAAVTALFSIIPPVDAFNVSSQSQENRIERILIKNDMLQKEELTANSSVSHEDKFEITGIMNYMVSMGHLEQLEWLPEQYKDKKYFNDDEYIELFGFSPQYSSTVGQTDYIYRMLAFDSPLNIEGYEMLYRINLYNEADKKKAQSSFDLNGVQYFVNLSKSEDDFPLIITDGESNILEVNLKQLFADIVKTAGVKEELSAQDLTIQAESDVLRIRLIFESISVELSSSGEPIQVNGSAYLMAVRNGS